MEQLVILDSWTSEVHIYSIANSETDIDEEYMKKLGHNTNNCQWMFCEDCNIIHHKEPLQ